MSTSDHPLPLTPSHQGRGEHPIPLTVLGGFLGAGKTTLVNHLLRAELDRRVAVLVNDFGAIDIDAELITARDGETLSLANGCVCCSLAGGLMKALLELCQRPEPPEHLLIETSGVADPWKIAQIGLAGRAFRLDAIIVLADAETVREQSDDPHVGDIIRRQLAVADLLVLNKCDLIGTEQRRMVRDWLDRQVPGARVIETEHAQLSPELLLGEASARSPAAQEMPDSQDHEAVFQRWSFSTDQVFDGAALRTLIAELPPGVLRAKGVVRLAEDPERRYILQRVGRRWSLQPGDGGTENPTSRLVVLGMPGSFEPVALEVRFREAVRSS